MKRATMILGAAAMTALALPVFGQTSADVQGAQLTAVVGHNSDRIRSIENNYLDCMESGCNAVVESAIAQAVRMRWALPSADLETMKEQLGSLALHGNTLAIRYKASMAAMVFDAPSIFTGESGKTYQEDADLFAAVGSRAQKALVGFDGEPR